MFKELNEKLEKYILTEMAQINDTIEVNNEDKTNIYGKIHKKFAHFHWLYKKRVHFKFANRVPKTVSELRQLIAFSSEQKLISDTELRQLLKDLNTRIIDIDGEHSTVYNAAIKVWKVVHPYRDLSKEFIIF